jgi:hypothetical protein
VRGEPVWQPARLFAIPGGALMVLQSTLLDGRRLRALGLGVVRFDD